MSIAEFNSIEGLAFSFIMQYNSLERINIQSYLRKDTQ